MESMIPVGDKSKSSSSSSSSIGRDRLAEGRLLAGEREDPVEASELELAGGATAGRTRELTDGGSFAWSTISTEFESACATWPEFVILI